MVTVDIYFGGGIYIGFYGFIGCGVGRLLS